MKKGIVIIDRDFSGEWLPILKKSGINTLALHFLYQLGGLEEYVAWLEQEDTQAWIAELEENGILVEHQLHAVSWLLPRSLFVTRPEWFRMDKEGARTPNWNFCVTNEEALAYVEESTYALAKRLGQKSHDYYIWSDDFEGAVCHCEKCRRYNAADQNMLIMQCVLRGLKRYDSEAKLSFLGYQDTLELPTIPPDKDMFLEFAPIGRNHKATMESDEEANVKMRKALERLLTIFPVESTQILEYFLDVSLFYQWKRENAGALDLNEEQIRKDVAWYKGLGVAGITAFAVFMDDAWRAQYGDKDILLYGKILEETL